MASVTALPRTTDTAPAAPLSERELNFQVLRGVSGIIATLDEFRESSGVSKAELARRIDAQREAISRLLTPGDTNPTTKTIFRVLAGLGLHVDITIREARPEDEYLATVGGMFEGNRLIAGEDF